ncbi:MAG: hypothetical protein ACLUE8_18650 [Lachnospiraceae bacterium]
MNSARLRLVAAVFPAYDFARVIAGDAAEVTLLPPLRAWALIPTNPTPQDMMRRSKTPRILFPPPPAAKAALGWNVAIAEASLAG